MVNVCGYSAGPYLDSMENVVHSFPDLDRTVARFLPQVVGKAILHGRYPETIDTLVMLKEAIALRRSMTIDGVERAEQIQPFRDALSQS